MNIDLAFILVALTALSGTIWLVDSLLNGKHRAAALARLPAGAGEQERDEAMRMNFWVDLARSLFPVFFIVLLLRSFLVEPFRIPSGSMMPTLLVGDFILVNKYTYGIRLPVLNNKVFEIDKPERGDVVVFRYPEDPSIPFIKRVVGLPGDRIMYHNITKTLYINGEAVQQEPVGIYQGFGKGSVMTGAEERVEYLKEVEHHILLQPHPVMSGDKVVQLTVPENEYFVLGDNRDNSRDSRFWGTVPEANLIGKAFMIWMNGSLAGGLHVDWGRIGNAIE